MKKKNTKKIGNSILNILLFIFLVFCVLSVIITIFSKKDVDGASEVFGYQMRIVTTNSMGACDQTDVSDFEIGSIPVNAMVFVKLLPVDTSKHDDWYRSLKAGDVLTFRYVYTTQITITHRITSITEKETGGFIIELAGDNKNSDSDQLYQKIDTSVPNNTNYVIGKVVGKSVVFGGVISVLKNPIGMICIIMLPCLVIIILEVIKITRLLTADKKKRALEESQKKDKEFEELRRKLAELEKEKENGEK